MPEFDQKALLSTKEAGELFTYHPDYVGRLCRTGKVQGIQVGGSWMVNRSSLEKFVKAQGRVLEEVALETALVSKRRSEVLAKVGATVGVFAVVLLSFLSFSQADTSRMAHLLVGASFAGLSQTQLSPE